MTRITKKVMLERVGVIAEEIKPFLIMLKLKEDYITVNQEMDTSNVKEGYEWMNNIFSNEYLDVKNIWSRHTPQAWSRFDTVLDADMPEFKMLTSKLNILRKKLVSKKKPSLFKKVKKYVKKRKETKQREPKNKV